MPGKADMHDRCASEKKKRNRKEKKKKKKEKKRKEKTPKGVNLMRSQVLYRAAQDARLRWKHSGIAYNCLQQCMQAPTKMTCMK